MHDRSHAAYKHDHFKNHVYNSTASPHINCNSILWAILIIATPKMQVQRHLFKIVQRCYKLRLMQILCKIYFVGFLLAAVTLLSFFLFGELYLTRNTTLMRDCLAQNNFALAEDQLILIYDGQEDQISTIQKENKNTNKQAEQQQQKLYDIKSKQNPINSPTDPLYKQSDACTIYKNLNTTIIDTQTENQVLQISFNYSIYKTDTEFRDKLNIDNYTFVFNEQPNNVIRGLYGYFVMIARELVWLKDQGLLRTCQTFCEESTTTAAKYLYVKSSTVSIMFYEGEQKLSVFEKIKTILYAFFLFVVSSVTTSLYTYVTITSAPAVIMLILRCTRGNQFNEAFQAYSWIGMYSIILKTAQNKVVRSNFDQICFALIWYFIIVYLTYYMTIVLLSDGFFVMPAENGLPQSFFGFLALIELAALVFMRTRPFIKYFPIIHCLLCLCFLLYCQFSHFGYKILLCLFIQMTDSALFVWMIIKLEIPAQTTWNPATEFVPTENEPRAGFSPVFNINWTRGVPDEWSLLIPMHGKQSFNRKQLTFINRNYEQLNTYLNERHER